MGQEQKRRRKKKTGTELRIARERKERDRLLKEQQKTAAVRAKYGPSRRPSAVTVRKIETGEVVKVVDQGRFRPRAYSEWLNELSRAAGFESYADYVASPYWLGVRQRVLDRDRRRCVQCRNASNLQVHHDRYDHIGDEQLKFLKTICVQCHRRIHG